MEAFRCAEHLRLTPAVVDGHALVEDCLSRCLVGHSLTRRRWRYLQRAECIVVTEDPRLLGVAAYQRLESEVRVVHEFLVHRSLGEREASVVTDTLVSAVEAMALGDSINGLMFLLWPDVRRTPFERRGYRAVVLDPHLAWLQKTLAQGSCIHACPPHWH